MFKGSQPNPYDDVVAKTTDENLTGENWELILNLCDKVQDEGENGARQVIAALLKRLTHRNANVQLYTLSLAEALSKNCTITLHREIASRAFTQGLEKLINDRNAHDKVRQRALSLIAMWTAEFASNPSLGMMGECYNNLKAKNYKFDAPMEPLPPQVDDEVRRREEEELQRALELSVQDKGGRSQWAAYSLTSSSSASGSAPPAKTISSASNQTHNGPSTASGYVHPSAVPPQAYTATTSPSQSTEYSATKRTQERSGTPTPVSPKNPTPSILVTRVRALHTFEPTEPGELAFEAGDIIKVVDRGYKDWWRGQLRGRTGIFPVNYVEPMPEPTAADLAKEAEQEAAVFSQAADVDRLLNMLRSMDASKDNLADNEEIQELYRSCMALRPKVVKLIDKYSQKRADLVSMNESFVKARTIFETMMEESLTRHTQMYGSEYAVPPFQRGRPHPVPGGPQAYGWNQNAYEQPGYNAYPTPAVAYSHTVATDVYNSQPQSAYPQPGQQQPSATAYVQQPQLNAYPVSPTPQPHQLSNAYQVSTPSQQQQPVNAYRVSPTSQQHSISNAYQVSPNPQPQPPANDYRQPSKQHSISNIYQVPQTPQHLQPANGYHVSQASKQQHSISNAYQVPPTAQRQQSANEYYVIPTSKQQRSISSAYQVPPTSQQQQSADEHHVPPTSQQQHPVPNSYQTPQQQQPADDYHVPPTSQQQHSISNAYRVSPTSQQQQPANEYPVSQQQQHPASNSYQTPQQQQPADDYHVPPTSQQQHSISNAYLVSPTSQQQQPANEYPVSVSPGSQQQHSISNTYRVSPTPQPQQPADEDHVSPASQQQHPISDAHHTPQQQQPADEYHVSTASKQQYSISNTHRVSPTLQQQQPANEYPFPPTSQQQQHPTSYTYQTAQQQQPANEYPVSLTSQQQQHQQQQRSISNTYQTAQQQQPVNEYQAYPTPQRRQSTNAHQPLPQGVQRQQGMLQSPYETSQAQALPSQSHAD